jgi:type II secretory pathway pseudopilin PulG
MPLGVAARKSRGGYSLTELLVVIIIMITIFAIALPIAKKVMDDSHVREASRQLNAFFTLAKSRAAQTGRPCGIEFICERPLGDTASVRQVTKCFLAEVPEPYTGDVSNTLAKVVMTIGPHGPWTLEFAQAGSAFNSSLTTNVAVGSLLPLIGERNQFYIRFNYSGPWFRGFISKRTAGAPLAPLTAYIYGLAGADQMDMGGNFQLQEAWGDFRYDDNVDGQKNDRTEYLSPGSDDLRPPLPQVGVNGVPFQIIRDPQRVGSPLELPAGTCIDMTYSGLGPAGWDFIRPLPDTNNTNNRPLERLLVMFSASGAIDSYYYYPLMGVTNPRPALATLHFLVGKVEKMGPPAADPTIPAGLGSNANFGADMFDPEMSNLADGTSLWVSVGPSTGAVTTSENIPPQLDLTTSSLPNLRYRYTDAAGNTQNVALDVTTLASRVEYLKMCRVIAIGQEQMGGR